MVEIAVPGPIGDEGRDVDLKDGGSLAQVPVTVDKFLNVEEGEGSIDMGTGLFLQDMGSAVRTIFRGVILKICDYFLRQGTK